MKKIQPNEHDFRKWFIANYDGWCQRVEIAPGMNPGFPDLLLLTPSGLIPCELKIGTLSDDVLWSSEIRPSQISWHTNIALAGGTSMFAIGIWSQQSSDVGHWRVFLVDGVYSNQWEEKGFTIGLEAIEINFENLVEEITEFVFDYLE